MLSLSKIALFSLISFATLALAIPTPEPRQPNAKVLISDACNNVAQVMDPVGSNYTTPGSVGPILAEVVVIVNGLAVSLQGASLSGCTSQDILGLISTLLANILGPLGTACGANPGLLAAVGELVGELVPALVELLQVVLSLVGGLVGELLLLLVGNGCAGTILGLNLGGLVAYLGLGNLLSALGSLL